MVKGIVYLVIGTVALLFGAAQPWIMSFYALLMILGFGVCMWQGGLTWRPGPWVSGILGFFLLLSLLQVVPLPQGLLEGISPVRAQFLEDAGKILGIDMTGDALVYSAYRAVVRWGFVICLGLFFWMCVSFGRDRKTFKRMVMVLMGLGIFEMAYGLLQVLFPDLGVWWAEQSASAAGCARGTYINRNHFAGFMEMVWPLALGVTFAQGKWEEGQGIKAFMAEEHVGRQLVGFILVVLMVLALLFSRSRAGVLGCFLGMAAFLGVLRMASGRFRWGFRLAILALVGLVTVYGTSVGFDKILDRFMDMESVDGGRLQTWGPSWEMAKDYPAGVGLGNYPVVELVYVDRGEGRRSYYAHNDYLQLLIETGWAGAVVLVFGLFFFIVRAVRRIRKVGFDVGRFRLLVSVGALAGICSLAFHGFFDFNFQIPANQVYFVVLMALVESGLWPIKR